MFQLNGLITVYESLILYCIYLNVINLTHLLICNDTKAQSDT